MGDYSTSSSDGNDYDVTNNNNDLYLRKIEPTPHYDPIQRVRDEVMKKQFYWFVENGKVQASVSMLMLMDSYPVSPSICDDIPTSVMQRWQMAYVDMLFQRRLFIQKAQVIKMSKVSEVKQQSASSNVSLRSGSGSHRTRLKYGTVVVGKTRWLNERNKYLLCSICHLPVRGQALFCQTCSLSAHADCMKLWFAHLKSTGNKQTGCAEHSF